MTLKTYANEMSEKAKAFSVESLLLSASVATAGDVREGKMDKRATANSKLQTSSGIMAELCCSDLWEKFHRLETEMIVTKAGRRMFPTLKVRLHNLQFAATYIVYLDFTLASETRYRYNFQRSEWASAGPSNSFASNSVYVHPVSPARGEVWMSQESITFDRVKLTNHRKPLMQNQVSLHSLHKYQPRIHVLEMFLDMGMTSPNILEYIHTHWKRSVTFTFEQTAFITVTAYQNQQITKLKIESNPFAKGFRDSINAKREPATTGDLPSR